MMSENIIYYGKVVVKKKYLPPGKVCSEMFQYNVHCLWMWWYYTVMDPGRGGTGARAYKIEIL